MANFGPGTSAPIFSGTEWRNLSAAIERGELTIEDVERQHQMRQAQRMKAPSRPASATAAAYRQRTRRLAQRLPREVIEAGLKPSIERVAAVLWQLARSTGHTDASVPEIANRAGLSDRAVQLAMRDLSRRGWLTIEIRRIHTRLNETNVYRLAGPFMREGGERRFGVNLRDSESTSTTQYRNKDTQPVGHAPGGEQEISAGISLPSSESVTNAATTDSPEEWTNLAARAVEAIDGTVITSAEQPWQRLDRLRRDRLKIPDQLWQHLATRHQHRAALAVAEALLRPDVYFRRDRTAYVIGTLKKRPNECRPERSVARLIALRDGTARTAAIG